MRTTSREAANPPGSGGDEEPVRPPVFVHDFVPLDLDLATAAVRLAGALHPPMLARVVATASSCEIRAGSPGPFAPVVCAPEDVEVTVGATRWRSDAMVVPVAWTGPTDRLPVPLEADLELASYGLRRCHLHLLGRSVLADGLQAFTQEASLYNRLAVAVIRHILNDLALQITRPAVEAACSCEINGSGFAADGLVPIDGAGVENDPTAAGPGSGRRSGPGSSRGRVAS